MAVPMGFGAQIKALQESQREQAQRIEKLEKENKALLTMLDNVQDLTTRCEEFERHIAHLNSRRREAVSQFRKLRTLHQEASNAFDLRTCDLQPNDLEGMLCVYGTSTTTVLNHLQRALGQLRAMSQMSTQGLPKSQDQQGIGPMPHNYDYPMLYTAKGWSAAHSMPHPCRVCGR